MPGETKYDSDPLRYLCDTKRNRVPIYNVFMIETLYETQAPEKDSSECYVLVLTSRVSTRGTAYVFMEEHGRWDDALQRYRYSVNSINTDERLTYENAIDLYKTAKRNLALKGFIHSNVSDAQRKVGRANGILEPEMATV